MNQVASHCSLIFMTPMLFRTVQFSSVHHLSLHFPSNFGADVSCIYYIGLKGEFSPQHHHGVTICTYESRPNVSDHKQDLFDSVNQQIH